MRRGCPHDVMVKALNWGIVVNEFKPQLHYWCSLSDKHPWKWYEPPYPPSYELNSTASALPKGWI